MYYQANKEYIARVLCENRDKPQLHCDGKCYLAKRLKAAQDRQDKETTEQAQRIPTITLFCSDRLTFAFGPLRVTLLSSRLPGYLLKDYAAPHFPLFQPPQA